MGLMVPVVTMAFMPTSLLRNTANQQSLRTPTPQQPSEFGVSSWSDDGACSSFTQLNMAFDSDKPSNMFDGPMALTKERDACGVGFVANTKLGGEYCCTCIDLQAVPSNQ